MIENVFEQLDYVFRLLAATALLSFLAPSRSNIYPSCIFILSVATRNTGERQPSLELVMWFNYEQ